MTKVAAALAALNELHAQRRLQYRAHLLHLRQVRTQRQHAAVARERGTAVHSPAITPFVDSAQLEGCPGGAA